MSNTATHTDFNSLTMGELAMLERTTGQSLTSFEDETAPKAQLMTGLAWLIRRRKQPSYTYNEAEALTLDQVSELLGLNAAPEPEPTPPTLAPGPFVDGPLPEQTWPSAPTVAPGE